MGPQLNQIAICLHTDESTLSLRRKELERVVEEASTFNESEDVKFVVESILDFAEVPLVFTF